MAHPNEVLVQESLAAFRRGDMDALRQYWAEDIRFHVPGRSLLAGDYEGIAQFLGVHGRLSELSGGTVRAELRDVLASDEHVVMLYTGSAERAGKHWDGNYVDVIRIRDGKWAEDWFYPADLYAYDEFWS